MGPPLLKRKMIDIEVMCGEMRCMRLNLNGPLLLMQRLKKKKKLVYGWMGIHNLS